MTEIFFLQMMASTLWRNQGGGDCATAPAPFWSDREFLDNFCTAFVSFVSRLNRKIRVPRLVPVKNCVKMHQKLSF